MKTPSEKALRSAVLRWVRAEMKWSEFAMADVGGEAYHRLFPKANLRLRKARLARAKLLALGMRLMLASKRKRNARAV